MKRLAKALSAFTYGRSVPAAGRDAFAFAGRGASSDVDGSGAPSVGRVSLSLPLIVVGLAAMVFAATASAKEVDQFVGGPGGSLGNQFLQPRDIAVNETTGDVYVADENNHRIVRRSAIGVFERAWGRDVVAGNPGTGFEICTAAAQCQKGSEGQGSGQFISPAGIAVDQADGSVYVWDTRQSNTELTRVNVRIQKFDADGNFVLMFGKGVNLTSTGDVCTQASGNLCGPGLQGAAPGQLGNPSGNGPSLAVSPVDGDVFVADPTNRRVQRFNSDGTFQEVIGSSANFTSTYPRYVAVDSRGILYAGDGNTSPAPAAQIRRYDTAGVHGAPGFLTSISTPLLVGSATATFGLEVDPDSEANGAAGADTDRLFVLRDPTTGNTVVQQFDSPGEAVAPAAVTATHGNAATFSTVRGLGLNSASGSLYVSLSTGTACGTTCQGYFVLDDDGAGPAVASNAGAANVTATTADLTGTVDPGSGFVSYHFEYSVDGSTYLSTPDASLEGSGPQPVAAPVTGLEPNTLYRVKVVAEKILGPDNLVSSSSAEGLFTTNAAPPDAITQPIGPRTTTTAELRGTVDPNGTATNYWFEYGADTSYGTKTPFTPAPAGSGNSPLLVVQPISGLLPNTTYHYRVVADGFGLAVNGADRSFVTLPVKSPPALDSRAYELVSPADKVGGVGVGTWGGGATAAAGGSGFAAHVGERFGSQGDFGSILLDGATAYASDWALGQRTPSGWVNHSPITHGATNRQSYRFLNVSSASEDLSKVVWTSNFSLLRPFPELASWPDLYVDFTVDWSGRWEIVAPTNLNDQMHTIAISPLEDGRLARSVLSADGSQLAFTTGLPTAGTQKSLPGGLAGEGDPTHPKWNELLAGRAVYVVDQSAGLSDRFEGNGVYSNAGVCADDTLIPERNGSGLLEDQPCAAPVGLPVGPDDTLISSRGAALQSRNKSQLKKNVISSDGSRVFFMSPDPIVSGVPVAGCTGTGATTLCPPQLYVRQRNSDGSVTTRWISKASSALFGNQSTDLTGQVRFAGASKDGSVVFFQTNSPLTADDPNGAAPVPGGVLTGAPSNSSWDLYAYALPAGPDGDPGTPDADPAGGALTRVSAGPAGSGDCNVVTEGEDGALRFVAEGGSRAYFTCAAPLAGVPDTADGTITSPGGTVSSIDATNLYSYAAEGGGVWEFVARLPRGGSGNPIGWCATTGNEHTGGLLTRPNTATASTLRVRGGSPGNCVRGSADGEFLTFWTKGRLTIDDPDETTVDAYAYDAATERLTRITAAQGGVGGSYMCDPYALTLTGQNEGLVPSQCNGDDGFGTPGQPELLGVASRPAVPGDRIAFFQSRSRLVAEDVDNAYDVYQWRNGNLSLISTGDSAFDGSPGELGGAFYKGNDETGRNVYFATNDRLSWQDTDAVLDIYTARLGGGIPQPLAPPVCAVLSDACQGALDASPAAAAASSAAFQGAGNMVPKQAKPKPKKCAKGKVRKGKRCVKTKRKAKGAKRPARHDRRAAK